MAKNKKGGKRAQSDNSTGKTIPTPADNNKLIRQLQKEKEEADALKENEKKEPDQIVPLPTSVGNIKLIRQLQREKAEADALVALKENQKKIAVEAKKKPKTNKGDKKKLIDPEVRTNFNKLDIPDDAKFKGVLESNAGNFNFQANVCNYDYGRNYQQEPLVHPKSEASTFAPEHTQLVRNDEYFYQMEKIDPEFQDFLRKKNISCLHIKEITGDLFSAPEEYSLAHCVAEDFNMGAGIALTFRSKFQKVADLLNQDQRTGGLAVLKHEERFIYYLVTKKQSRGKPTLYTLWLSMQKLKVHCSNNNVTKLAIPQIGCGLDRLEWRKVKEMLAVVFENTSVQIVVYKWEQPIEDTQQLPRTAKKGFVRHRVLPLMNINPYTGLIYFGSMDGEETEQFANISAKCPNLLAEYKRYRKGLGDVIRTEHGSNYTIYGLVVKSNVNSSYDFLNMERALLTLRNFVGKDKYSYVAFEGFVEGTDDIIVDKIISLMQFILKHIEIWVCWPKHLESLCPIFKSE